MEDLSKESTAEVSTKSSVSDARELFAMIAYVNKLNKNGFISLAILNNLEWSNLGAEELKIILINYFRQNMDKFIPITLGPSSPSLNVPVNDIFSFNKSNSPDEMADNVVITKEVAEKFTDNNMSHKLKESLKFIFRTKVRCSGENPSDILSFFESFEFIKSRYGIDDKSLLLLLPECLVGSILLMFKANESSFSSFSEFKDYVRQVYLPKDFDKTLRREIESRLMSPSESLDLYVSKLKLSSKKLDVPFSEAELLDIVKSNAKPNLLFELNRQSITSLNEALLVARVVDSIEARKSNYVVPQAVNAVDPVLNAEDVKKPKYKSQVAAAEKKQPVVRQGSQMVCFKCSGVGHGFRSCSSTKEVGLFCFGCGEKGKTRLTCNKCKLNI